MSQGKKKVFRYLILAHKRRRVLITLAGIVPAARFLSPLAAWATADEGAFVRISRIITGTALLSADISQRIQSLLANRTDQFASRLNVLASTMKKAGGSRQEMLSALSDEQVKLALEIAKPWYLGYVGTPSDFVLKDDAAFATFLEAQAWEKIVDEVPRPTYPHGNAGWWVVAPPGVNAPAMPDAVTSWTFHPGGPSQILAPDTEWKAYALAKHSGIAEARRAKPATGNVTSVTK
jgi:hypothetical protein